MRDWLAVRAEATPKATALSAADASDRSYGELDERVEVLAGRLAALGVGVGDAVAACLETRREFVALVHALQRLGAVLVPLHADQTPPELRTQLSMVEPTVAVCGAAAEATLLDAVDEPSEGAVPTVVSVDDPTADARPLSAVRPQPFDLPEWGLDEPLAVLFTSGTTGEPKGVVLTLGNVLASATASAFRLGVRRDDCWHVPLPMSHMGGLAPVYRSVLYGTALSLQSSFDAEATAERLRATDATAVSLVPTMLERLLDADDLPDLRFVLVGGAPCPPALVERASDRGLPVAPTYGMTETASQIATASPPTAREHPRSVGHPLMFAEVTVVGDDGVGCEPGTVGDIVVDGPMVTPGYLDDETTAERFTTHGLSTGDRGYRDDDGRLHVVGRADDTIVTGGENVAPTEVESALQSHPAVESCAVVGLDDGEWGQRVAALVVADGDAPDADALREHCRDRLAGYKLPRTIGVADSLPRTASGTVDREAVRGRLDERQ